MNPLEIPKLDYYINDFSGVLGDEEKKSLNELFVSHERTTTEQVVVVLFPHREGHELLDIGMKVFNENGIGQKGKNNGLLLIIATEEKKIRLITGKGMEIEYTEMRCRDIIENHLRPLLNESKYDELIKVFFNIVSSEMGKDKEALKNVKKSKDVSNLLTFMGGFVSFFGFLFADGFFSGVFMVILSVLVFLLILKLQSSGKFMLGRKLYIIPFILFLVGLSAVLFPAICTIISENPVTGTNYSCERTILGYNYRYSKTIGGQSYSSNGSSSSSHSYSNGGSSHFSGGGGHSNGGGHGD